MLCLLQGWHLWWRLLALDHLTAVSSLVEQLFRLKKRRNLIRSRAEEVGAISILLVGVLVLVAIDDDVPFQRLYMPFLTC